MQPEQQPLHEDGELLIRYAPGTSTRMVVAFTGIGHHLGAIQQDEFIGASTDGGRNHALFVTDLGRTWYSANGLVAKVLETIQRVRRDAGIQSLATLGNSMGGYGALLFGELLKARVAIGFVPQFSMNPAVVDEPRWQSYRPAMVVANLDTAAARPAGTTQRYAIFGADLPADMIHADLYSASDRTEVLRFPGARHDIARRIKSLGLLSPLIQAMLTGTIKQVRAIEATYGSRVRGAVRAGQNE